MGNIKKELKGETKVNKIKIKTDINRIGKNEVLGKDVQYLIIKCLQTACVRYINGDENKPQPYELLSLIDSYLLVSKNIHLFQKEKSPYAQTEKIVSELQSEKNKTNKLTYNEISEIVNEALKKKY